MSRSSAYLAVTLDIDLQAQRRGVRHLVQAPGGSEKDLMVELRKADPNPGSSFDEWMEGIAAREKGIYGATVSTASWEEFLLTWRQAGGLKVWADFE